MRIRRFLFDLETFSPTDIDAGPNRYAIEPGAGAWCASWGAKGGDETKYRGPYITVLCGGAVGIPVIEAELHRRGFDVRPAVEFFAAFDAAEMRVAHNAPFERACMRWMFGRETPAETWSCTLARSTRLGLPPSLEGVLIALRAPVEKDLEGSALSKKMGKAKAIITDGAGGRLVLWHDDFKSVLRNCEYCVTDFIGEAWLDDAIPELEPKEVKRWCRQSAENDLGINVDWDLVATQQAVVEKTAAMIEAILPNLTDGRVKSLNTAKPLQAWCADRLVAFLVEKRTHEGYTGARLRDHCEARAIDMLPNLRAETVDLLLDSTPEIPDDVRDILEARRSVRTSAAKLEALVLRRMPARAGRSAGRVCDLTQWGGARTLRTVGRGPQPLNFPRPGDVDVKEGLAILRQCVFDQLYSAVSKDARERQPSEHAGVTTYRGPVEHVWPSEVVAATLRGTLVPTKGRKFVAVDYSGVEARAVLALAGQRDAIELFKSGGDIYCDLATVIYGYEISKKTDGGMPRQLGKQGILGCLGSDTMVCTLKGWKRIAEVTTQDRVWDGMEWVRCQGSYYSGMKCTIGIEGLRLTPDHQILCGSEWLPAESVVGRESILRRALETGLTNSPLRDLCSGVAEEPCRFSSSVIAGRRSMASIYLISRKAFRTSVMRAQKSKRGTGSKNIGPTLTSSKTTGTARGCSIGYLQSSTVAKTQRPRAFITMAGEVSEFSRSGATIAASFSLTSSRSTAGQNLRSKSIASITTAGMNRETFASQPAKRTSTIGGSSQTKSMSFRICEPVFDILNCGPRNRFVVRTAAGPLVVHNCGFGLSNPETFQKTCAKYGLYITLELAEKVIKSYSSRFDKMLPMWRAIHRCARDATENPGQWQTLAPRYNVAYRFSPVGAAWVPEGMRAIAWLECWLPSGRIMYYPEVTTAPGDFGMQMFVMSWKNGHWAQQTLTRQVTIENIIQAICRDMMEDDKEDILSSGRDVDVTLTVYDEILGEFPEAECEIMVGEGKHAMPEPQAWMESMMSRELPWFPLMPRGVEGWTGGEYKK